MARLELGRCLRVLGDPSGDAAEHLRVAAQYMPDRAAVPMEQAQLAQDAGDAAAARAHWEAAARLTPADVRVIGALALSPPPAEGAAATLARLRQLVARSPVNLAAWRRLAEVAEAAGALDEAEAALRAVLERSANRRAAAAALGRFGTRHGRAAAVEAATRALGR